MMLWLELWLVIQALPPVQTIWPTSVVGWLGGITGVISISLIISDRLTGRGKNLERIANNLTKLDDRVTDIENTDKIIDQKLDSIQRLTTEINYELRGTQGDNGIKARVRSLQTEIAAIQERNRKMDILAGVFEQMIKQYSGPERRASARVVKDLFRDLEEE